MKDVLLRTWTAVSIGVALLIIAGYIALASTTDKRATATNASNLPPLFAVGKRLECQVSESTLSGVRV